MATKRKTVKPKRVQEAVQTYTTYVESPAARLTRLRQDVYGGLSNRFIMGGNNGPLEEAKALELAKSAVRVAEVLFAG